MRNRLDLGLSGEIFVGHGPEGGRPCLVNDYRHAGAVHLRPEDTIKLVGYLLQGLYEDLVERPLRPSTSTEGQASIAG